MTDDHESKKAQDRLNSFFRELLSRKPPLWTVGAWIAAGDGGAPMFRADRDGLDSAAALRAVEEIAGEPADRCCHQAPADQCAAVAAARRIIECAGTSAASKRELHVLCERICMRREPDDLWEAAARNAAKNGIKRMVVVGKTLGAAEDIFG